MYYVYVLRDFKTDKSYIGYTSDLERRLKEHKSDNVHTTLRFSESNLIFYEAFVAKEDAVRRESYFKTTKGKKALKLILRESLKQATE